MGRFWTFLCLLFLAASLQAQERPLYQLTGVVIHAVLERPVPYADIVLLGTARGTAADRSGYFSLVVRGGDSIQVTAVGYKALGFRMPDTLADVMQYWVMALQPDTVMLDAADVYPWPARGDLRRAMLETNVHSPEDDIAPYAGFHRVDNPQEPKATIMSPASFIFEKIVKPIQRGKRKRSKAKRLPKMK
jgi:hypothetical protein